MEYCIKHNLETDVFGGSKDPTKETIKEESSMNETKEVKMNQSTEKKKRRNELHEYFMKHMAIKKKKEDHIANKEVEREARSTYKAEQEQRALLSELYVKQEEEELVLVDEEYEDDLSGEASEEASEEESEDKIGEKMKDTLKEIYSEAMKAFCSDKPRKNFAVDLLFQALEECCGLIRSQRLCKLEATNK